MRFPLMRVLGGVAIAATTLAAVPASSDASTSDGAGELEEMADAASDFEWTSPLETTERATVPTDRYELAGGCYALASAQTGSFVARDGDGYAADAADPEAFHLKATDLGRYLLFDRDERFVAANEGLLEELLGRTLDNSAGAMVSGLTIGASDGLADELAAGPLGELTGRGDGIVAAEEPSELADWELTETDDGFRISLPVLEVELGVNDAGELALYEPSDDARGLWRFELREDGCATWPEVEVNVDGPVATGETPYGETRGYLDGHLHGMAFEFLGGRARCGRPWHPYGVAYALDGCQEHEALGGRTHILEFALSGSDPVAGHDTAGWPTFNYWPAHQSLTYEQTYHRWIERAWRGGLRMYVNLLVDNNKLCQVYPFKRNSCNEMDGVRLQHEQIHAFRDYIDAQHGGPGKGWLEIVTDPFEARRVMNEGKLAVVLGIEVSRLFDCQVIQGQPTCDREQIDRNLDEVHAMGIRQMEAVNKFDNAFSGVAGDSGETGLLVNSANLLETGSFWRMEPCDDPGHDHAYHGHDRTQPNVGDEAGLPDEAVGRDALFGAVLSEVGKTGAAPVYPPGPHCNSMGLTELGEYLLQGMIERGMLFDPDHMSARARDEAMTVMEEEGYSGVISSHSWADDNIYERVLGLGGIVTPMAGGSTGFVDTWKQQREWADDRFYYGIGYGSDINGFATQGGPRGEDVDNPVEYPFEGFGGTTIHQQVSGERVYDINTDGVAHYGLYPDWVEDLRRIAGDDIVEDLERGPEAYLQMWERAIGVPADGCRDDVEAPTNRDFTQLERGMTPERVLVAVGQPRERDGQVFRYCNADGHTVELTFDDDGGLHRMQRRGPTEPPKGGPPEGEPAKGANAADADEQAQATAAAHDHDDHDHGDASDVATSAQMTPAAASGDTASRTLQTVLLLLGLAGLALHQVRGSRRRGTGERA